VVSLDERSLIRRMAGGTLAEEFFGDLFDLVDTVHVWRIPLVTIPSSCEHPGP